MNLIEYIDQDIDRAFIDSTIGNASFRTPQDAKDLGERAPQAG